MAVVALVLASCGEEEPKPSYGLEYAEPVALPEGSTPKVKYVRRVNRICALKGTGINADVTEAVQEQFAAGRSGAEAFTLALADVFPLLEHSLQRAYAIPPPPGDRTDLEKFWGYVRQAFATSREYFDAYKAGDTEGLLRTGEALDQQEAANAFAKAYGIAKCTGFTDSRATQLGARLESG